MNHATHNLSFGRGWAVDTLLVLFFLSLEFSLIAPAATLDGLIMGITMAMVFVLPYFLPSKFDRPAFASWVALRSTILLAGLGLGIAIGQAAGTVLPGAARSVPLTFLILASMVSCYIRFYTLLNLRPVK